MHVLVGNIVKTDVADYPCATREEAEALYLALRNRRLAGAEDEKRREVPQGRSGQH